MQYLHSIKPLIKIFSGANQRGWGWKLLYYSLLNMYVRNYVFFHTINKQPCFSFVKSKWSFLCVNYFFVISKAYGGVLMFYEKANMALLTSSQKSLLLVQNHEASERIVYATKSICVISQWPFFDAFHTFLKHLHKLCSGLPQSIPIERYKM